MSYEFTGRGGTDFAPICKLAEQKRYQSLIILTDGYATAPERPQYVKDVLWVLCEGGKSPVDWGTSVMIEEEKVVTGKK
jgi:predicted metal-dependent peptidase